MSNLEFETTEEWNLVGTNKRPIYLSLVAKIDGWKKSVVFYEQNCSRELWEILWGFTKEARINWEIEVETQRAYMNSVFVSEVYFIRDHQKKQIWPLEPKENKEIIKDKETELKRLEKEISELKKVKVDQ